MLFILNPRLTTLFLNMVVGQASGVRQHSTFSFPGFHPGLPTFYPYGVSSFASIDFANPFNLFK
jgi:hypothetical protein